MTNENIQIGIDLGTTNSEIAINKNGKPEIVKNVFGDEYTPSVFGIDKSKNKVVGKRAYERLYKDGSKEEFNNNKAEIKRLMGTSEMVSFQRMDAKMSPEEISAEILKSLKEDVVRKYPDFNTAAVVITVPASFSVLQSEATKRAGNLAGFKYVILLQEPIAAAMAYGFMNAKNENWLIYDLGGGTFDVALISSKENVLSVLSHSGDNFLGGKNFDWLIVDSVIVPKILEKYSLANFDRGNDLYRGIFAKLKYIAETGKISLSQYDKTTLEVDGIGTDEGGQEIYLSIDFSRKEFEKLIKPLIDRTIDLSREALKEAGIKSSLVNKIVLVGGPTQIPYIRERLEAELGIEVDSSVDPLTVVARGASVFGLGQKIPQEFLEKKAKVAKGTKTLILNYEMLTSETEEPVSGIVDELRDSEEEYYIQIQSDSGHYSGSKIKLRSGKFFDTVALERNKQNTFWVYLFDNKGNSVPIDPDSFSITHGLSVSGAPIPHSIGIAVANRSGAALIDVFEKIFEKGSVLPLKKTEIFKTARRLQKNEDNNPLWIRVGEGESDVPDQNTFVCELGIKGSNLPYDLPESTDIEITIEVNESREVSITAYIPLIDLSVNARSTFRDEALDVNEIENELATQSKRATSVLQNASPEEKGKIDNMLQSKSTGIKNARLDEDEKRKANKQMKDLKIAIDRLEKEKEMPQLTKEFNDKIAEVENIINDNSSGKDKEINLDQLAKTKSEGERAIATNDKVLLGRVNQEIAQLGTRILLTNPAVWVHYFQQVIQKNNFIDEKEAKYYIEKGRRAIELNDVEELKRCVHNLMLLLPKEQQQAIKNNVSGITH